MMRKHTAVTSSLATIVNKRFAGKLSEEKVKEKFAKYARNANCEELRVPTVNSEIWKIVRANQIKKKMMSKQHTCKD